MDPTQMQPGMQPGSQSPMGGVGTAGGGDLQSLLQRLSPEQLHQLMGLGTLNEKGDQIEEQMKMAEEMRKQISGGQSYGAGAGLGNGLAAIFTALHERSLRGDQGENTAAKGAGRDSFADMIRSQQQPASPQGMPQQPQGQSVDDAFAALVRGAQPQSQQPKTPSPFSY